MIRPAFRSLLAVLTVVAAPGSLLAQITQTRSSSFTYDAAGMLTREVIEPNQPALRLQSDYTYNAFGRKTQATVSGVGITTRSSSTTFDAKGQFATSSSNALGHTESSTYDSRFGLPLSQTGPNGLTTTWTYDTFGRKTLEVRADGTRTTWSYQFCSGFNGGTASCPATSVYLVQVKQFAANGTTQVGPTATSYHDQLARVIYADTQGFDGSLIRVATVYDALGRVQKKSKPYFVTGGTPRWITYSYDALGRVVSETQPDNSTSSVAFHGLSTTTTNALGHTQTTVKNSQGKVTSVTDALGNTRTFKYDAYDNLIRTTDPLGNVATATYDTRGRKITSVDPDLGSHSYSYNVLDQLVSQTNPAGQVTTITYDLLGRTTQRVDADLTSNWVYDTAVKGIGKLTTASTTAGYSRSHAYDSLGRPTQTQLTIDGTNYTFTTAYDSVSRISAATYPSGSSVNYTYNTYGYQNQLKDGATAQAYWTALARDQELRLTQDQLGNGVTTTQAFDTLTGRLTGIQAGTSGAVENMTFTYDALGRLLTRGDTAANLSESFGYDALSRMTSASVSLTPTPLTKTFSYNAIGNLLLKSDVGTYTYPAAGQPRPSGVTSVAGTYNATFTYDIKGNMTAGNGWSMTYTSYNKPATITKGGNTLTFTHDSEQNRVKQVSNVGTTHYLNDPVSGLSAERLVGTGGAVTWTNYLSAAGGTIGMRVQPPTGPVLTRYFHKDHLGSITCITNEAGAVVERQGYDAWGKRRFANGADDTNSTLESQTSKGFTGHEMLDQVDIVHMNGRVYDPILARFTSADPVTENPLSTQGWNRYAYVGNSPLNFTDPSGYCFLGCFWQPVFRAVGQALINVPILRTVVQVAASALCLTSGPAAPACAALVAGATSAAITGLTGGSWSQALKAGFISAATSLAFNAVGNATGHQPDFGTANHVANIAGHAAVGCISSVASGGKCGPGAAAAAIGAVGAPLVRSLPMVAGAAVSAGLGGLASVATGGKFATGAETAAFGYLFNEFSRGTGPNKQIHVNPWDVGNDAHGTLQNDREARIQGVFSERYISPDGAFFGGGRVDLGNEITHEIWEIKPNNAAAVTHGTVQLLQYSAASAWSGVTYLPGGSSIFSGQPGLTLMGRYGAYDYRIQAGGVITYDFTPAPNVVWHKSFATYWGQFYSGMAPFIGSGRGGRLVPVR